MVTMLFKSVLNVLTQINYNLLLMHLMDRLVFHLPSMLSKEWINFSFIIQFADFFKFFKVLIIKSSVA